jgi:MFS family permease
MSRPTAGRLRAVPAALGERDFRLLFVGHALSRLGSGMVGVALAFAVLDATGSVGDLGLVLACRTVALSVFLLPAGVLADRFSRRGVLVVSDVVSFGSQGVLAALVISGQAQIWQFCALQAISGSAYAFFLATITGLTAQIVGPARLQQANALRSFTTSAGNVAGPALAGVLVASIGPGSALATDAASFAISAGFLGALRGGPHAAPATSRLHEELVEGWRAFRSRRWLLLANAHAALMNMVVLAAFYVLGPAVARRSLNGAADWALITTAFGLGLVAGSLAALRLRPQRRMLLGLVLGVLFAPPLALLALAAPAPAVASLAVLAGGQLTLLNTFWETTIQEQVPPALISRVTAIDWLSSVATQPIGYAVVGVLASSVLGIGTTLWLAAGTALVASAAIAAFPSIRHVRAETQAGHRRDSDRD